MKHSHSILGLKFVTVPIIILHIMTNKLHQISLQQSVEVKISMNNKDFADSSLTKKNNHTYVAIDEKYACISVFVFVYFFAYFYTNHSI